MGKLLFLNSIRTRNNYLKEEYTHGEVLMSLVLVAETFAPYRDALLFIHVLSVMIWLWSASIAYTWMLRPAWLDWQRNPGDPEIKARRDWVFEHYDKGLEFEHLAMLFVYISGPLLFVVDGWSLDQAQWMFYKLCIAFLLFLPLEIFDCYLAHFHGNKKRIRLNENDDEKYEKYMRVNWAFLQFSAPLAVVGILVGFYLAIVKPVF